MSRDEPPVPAVSPRVRRNQQLRVVPAPLVARFGLFAERLEVQTNDPRILAAAEASFGRFVVPVSGAPLVVRLVVAEGRGEAVAAPPDARGLLHETAGHLLTIVLGTSARAVVDADRGFATGSVSAAVAGEPGLLRYAFIEAMALALLTGGRGYVPIHASCVVRDGVGVILQGPAGTGKSTLALACARRGWGLLAEDVVFARRVEGSGPGGSLELWGMPWTQRLLPDAPRFFADLAAAPVRLQANGELKLEVDLEAHAPGAATPRATAGPFVLLARDTGGPTRAEWLAPPSHTAAPASMAGSERGSDEAPGEGTDDGTDDATQAIEVLWPWEAGWTPAHEQTAARLLDHGLLRLHLNGTPDEAADRLGAALEGVLGVAGDGGRQAAPAPVPSAHR